MLTGLDGAVPARLLDATLKVGITNESGATAVLLTSAVAAGARFNRIADAVPVAWTDRGAEAGRAALPRCAAHIARAACARFTRIRPAVAAEDIDAGRTREVAPLRCSAPRASITDFRPVHDAVPATRGNFDEACRRASVPVECRARIRAVTVHRAAAAIAAPANARGVRATLRGACAIRIRLTLHCTVEDALFAVITLFPRIPHAVLAFFIFTQSAATVAAERSAIGGIRADTRIRCAVNNATKTVRALPAVIALLACLHDVISADGTHATDVACASGNTAFTSSAVCIHAAFGSSARIVAGEITAKIIEDDVAFQGDFTIEVVIAGARRGFIVAVADALAARGIQIEAALSIRIHA